MKIAGVAINQTPLDWQGNMENIITAIRVARLKRIEILCFPELCISGYGCEDLFLSNWIHEKALDRLFKIIPECRDMMVVVGLPFRYLEKTYNGAAIIQNGELSGIYAKQFLANDGVHYEPRWFTPWERDKVVQVPLNGKIIPLGDIHSEFKKVRIGYEICEDAWQPDRPAHRLKKKGVHLILNPSASHFSMGKSDIRKKLVMQSSRNFDCAYLYTNLLGNEAGRMIYDGEILVAQDGDLINQNNRLSFLRINLVFADINFDYPFLTPRAKPSGNDTKNEEFLKAATLGLFDYLRKSKNRGYVISLSGGADSSCCAILVAEMIRHGVQELGTEKFLERLGRPDILNKIKGLTDTEARKIINSEILTCAYQSSENSSPDTFHSAQSLAEEVGCSFYSWNISDESSSYVKKIEGVLDRKLSWEFDDIALQNIQARARSPIIWMLANIKKAILITTSNRSEGDVGYATMDGDTSGSLAPIAAVDKSFLRQWLVWAERNLGYRALAFVNNLVPTAELRPRELSQTDEKDLMPYPVLVEIEKLAIRERLSPVQVYWQLKNSGLEDPARMKAYIKRFFRLWAANQWKRERMAPSFHLDDFNIDPRTWCRFPILSGSFIEELNELDNTL